jgi:hypothetical protein
MPNPIIGSPTNIRRGGSANSPVLAIDAKARAAVPNWKTALPDIKARAVLNAFIAVFAERHWRYAAGFFPGLKSTNLLLGQQTMQQLEQKFNVSPSMDCGRIADLLALCMKYVAGVDATPKTVVTGLFMTRKMGVQHPGIRGAFASIDSNVYGNVRSSKTPYQMVSRCIFRDHYATHVGATIYDATLKAVYNSPSSIVEMELKENPADKNVLIPKRVPVPGGPPVERYQKMTNEQPNGFSCGYMKI